MPLPGPRTQFGPVDGYRNPDGEIPDRLNQWLRPGPVASTGRTPATMIVSVRGSILAPGTVRRLWRQTVNYIAAGAPYSWTASAPTPDAPSVNPGVLALTRALRYMTRNTYIGAGVDNSRFGALHTTISPRVNSKPVTVNAGTVRNRPTVRNRLTSFGSRVPPLNARVSAAQKDDE